MNEQYNSECSENLFHDFKFLAYENNFIYIFTLI